MAIMHRLCAVIPVYDHERAVPAVLRQLLANDIDCIVVDDGSQPSCAAVLRQLATQPRVVLLRLAVNQGKGCAVLAGMHEAHRLGYTHALQVDADGQHDLAHLHLFSGLSATSPDAVVCGYPVYDASVPKARLYSRYLTHVWVWINTLSLDIRDSMCGFRIYPLGQVLDAIATARIGRRMDFDTDILVRLHWRRLPMLWLPVRVNYPADGVSHFRLWHDNVLISRMHARLFFGMLMRSPRLLWNKWR
jgi:glycosyltransferase involved in cell wall biosynthesis